MSCFAGMPSPPPPGRARPSKKTWRWWWRRCVGLAAEVHSRLRRGRRTAPPLQRGWCHHRSFAPVYVDELYSQPKNLSAVQEEEQTTTSGGKAAAPVAATAGAGAGDTARASGHGKSGDVRRSVWLSPGRGGGVTGMGEVDVRAELFIRKFREEMRLQRQKSAEEFQAMLARGL